jgi:8-oxo-dGTP diphosphatase
MEPDRQALDTFRHPHLTVDVALLTLRDGALHALLLRRREPPFANTFTLPGGFVREHEPLASAAARVLAEKCDLHDVFLEQLFTFGAPDRDPRGHVVSVAYYALVPHERLHATLGDDLDLLRIDVRWNDTNETNGGPVRARALDARGEEQPLGFDHAEILGTTMQRLRGKIDYAPVGFELLGETFTLLQLLEVHEAVLGRKLNKDSFRRRLLTSGLLQETGDHEGEVAHRPAALYRFLRSNTNPARHA